MGGGSHYQRCARCQIRFNFNVQFQFNIFIGVHDARLREERARHCSRFEYKSWGYSGLGQDDVYISSWRQFKLFLFWPHQKMVTYNTRHISSKRGRSWKRRETSCRQREKGCNARQVINQFRVTNDRDQKKGKIQWIRFFRCVWTKKLRCFSSHVATSLAVRWRKFISVTIWESESVCFIISTHEKVRVFTFFFLQVIWESGNIFLQR